MIRVPGGFDPVGRASVYRAAVIAAALVLVLNAVAFMVFATNPHIDRDEWFFLRSVVMPFVNGELDVTDLYRVRARSDHALPVQKLILLASVKWFHMDYRFQSWLGMLCGIAFATLLCRQLVASLAAANSAFRPELAVLLVLSILFSLNGTLTFRWPLVTLGYLGLCTVLILFLATDKAVNRPPLSPAWMTLAAASALVVADDLGALAVFCCLVALGISALRDRRMDLYIAGACVLLIFVAYRLIAFPQLVSHGAAVPKGNLGESGMFLLREPLQFYKFLVLPFANSVLHRSQLEWLPGYLAQGTHLLLGYGLLVLHLTAWYRYLVSGAHRITIVPGLLVLLSYLAMVGILLVRVPDSGFEYFNMPRYIRLYQIGLVGILWMWWLDSRAMAGVVTRPWRRQLESGVAAILMSAAILSAALAWELVPSLQQKQARYAVFLHDLLHNPSMTCPKSYVICRGKSIVARNELLAFLRDHELNVFRPGYEHGKSRDRNKL